MRSVPRLTMAPPLSIHQPTLSPATRPHRRVVGSPIGSSRPFGASRLWDCPLGLYLCCGPSFFVTDANLARRGVRGGIPQTAQAMVRTYPPTGLWTRPRRPRSMRPTSLRQRRLKNLSCRWLFRSLFGSGTNGLQSGRPLSHSQEDKQELCPLRGGTPRSLLGASTRGFLTFSSSFGLLPGAFLGSKVSRSSSCLQ